MAYLDSANVEDLVADIKALADQAYLPQGTGYVANIAYDSTNAKLTKTVNSTTSDVFTVDARPAQNSKNPVQSGGVYDSLIYIATFIGDDTLDTTAQTLIGAINEILAAVGDKVDKITGKGLSTNDYTTTEKTKLAGIADGAEVNVNADWNASSGDAQILNKPTLGNIVSYNVVEVTS